jgi:hypothetical protein
MTCGHCHGGLYHGQNLYHRDPCLHRDAFGSRNRPMNVLI